MMTPDDDLTPSLLQAFTDRHLATAPSGQFLAEQEASDAATKDAERQTAARDWLRTQGLGDSVPSPNDYDYGRMFDDGIYPSKDAAGRVPLPPQYWKPGRMLIGGRDIATGQRIASRVPLEDRILSGVEDDEPDDGDGISTLTQDDIAELSSRERRVLEAWMESHGVMIAAGPSQTRTDAPTGYYPKPNRPPTLDDLKQRGTDVWDVLAGALKGGVAQTLGLPGDVESLIRMLTGGEQVMPTTEDMEKKLPPVIPPTLSSLVTGGGQREANAAYGETAGEFIGLGKAPTAVARGVVKGAKVLAPTAEEMARRAVDRVVDSAGGKMRVVPEGAAMPKKADITFSKSERLGREITIGDNGKIHVDVSARFESSGHEVADAIRERLMFEFRPKLPEDTYWRFTNNKDEFRLAKNGQLRNSKNHADNFSEKGLSVADGAHYGIWGYKYAYKVKGPFVGYGSDGEPLIEAAAARPVGKLLSSEEAMVEDKALQKKLLEARGWTVEQFRDALSPAVPRTENIPPKAK